jgi:hypothetical protein
VLGRDPCKRAHKTNAVESPVPRPIFCVELIRPTAGPDWLGNGAGWGSTIAAGFVTAGP